MSAAGIGGFRHTWEELDRLRKEKMWVMSEISKMHRKLIDNPDLVWEPGDTSLSRLSDLSSRARRLSRREAIVDDALTSQRYALEPSGPSRRKPDGSEVAARFTDDDAEEDEWFVVKVIHSDAESKESEVLDEEPGDEEEDNWIITNFERLDE